MSEKRPNILFVFSDQQRWDTLGCYGQTLDVTPNLDRLASEGIRFDMAFTCQPVCGPARACLQTGQYATECGVHRNHIRLPDDGTFLADRMHEAGYETGYVGKWHLAANSRPHDPMHRLPETYRHAPVPPNRRGGWNEFWLAADALEHSSNSRGGVMWDAEMNEHRFEGYRVDWTTDCALRFLRERKGEKPFFLFTSYLEPHHQNNRERYEGPEGSWEKFKNFVPPADLLGTGGDWRQNFPEYLGCCHSIDRNFARLREELEKQGEWENTIVVFTSDHGSHFRTRNEEYKRSCHDASIHIPMIVSGSGFRGGQVVDELVSILDLTPTILRAGGAKPLPGMRGRALQDLADGRAPDDWRQEVFVQISEDHLGRALRTRRWTYSIKSPGSREAMDSPVYEDECLYDNEADPGQRNNLIVNPEYETVRAELAERLLSYMSRVGEPPAEIQERASLFVNVIDS